MASLIINGVLQSGIATSLKESYGTEASTTTALSLAALGRTFILSGGTAALNLKKEIETQIGV